MNSFKLFLTFIAIFFTTCSFAQNVTGRITDAVSNEALAGTTITVKSSKAGTVSAHDGSYSIKAGGSDVLLITRVGYQSLTVNVNQRNSINIGLTASTQSLTDIVLVGSRRTGRVKTETAVPVDVINVNQAALPTAKMDLTSILNAAAPSFNYNKQSGSDGADHIDLATLRGLGPDQTLVLINGKRRHQTAFVSVFGTRGRGNSGTDLNAIPEGSIDRVEILRDGASAQYGSDAIAGVINLILKKDVNKFTANAGWSGYNDKMYNPYYTRSMQQYQTGNAIDGSTFSLNTNYGLPIGKQGGFINFTGNFTTQGKTFRQISDTTNLFTNKDALIINNVRRANGDGSLDAGGFMYNAEIPVNARTTFYSFGGFNYKASDAFAFSRNFSGKPSRFPTDANGNLIYVPDIMHPTPDGDTFYNPHIQTHISDISFDAGLKGKWSNGWNWDISNTLGSNTFHFFGDKTFNAGLGASQTHFDDGGFTFTQNTTNVDFSKEIKNIAAGFNIALGAEYRYENYKMFAGEAASYTNYNTNKATGSQGFPGYQPSDVVNAKRNNMAIYADAELDATKTWLIGGAVRVENYSDFGTTANFKLATRVKAADNFNIRGSVSTGFRAPSLQQINFSSTFTTVQGGNISEVKIAPNYSLITKAAGIPNLKQETSLNGSIGFTWKPAKALSITVDGYIVNVKDRVVLSGQFDASDATLDPVLTGTLNSLNVGLAQFFANAVNTTNSGIDMVIEYNKTWKNNSFKILLAGNLQTMSIDNINVPAKLNDTKNHQLTFLSDREQKFILASAPPAKFSLGFDYTHKKFGAGLHLTYFGKVSLLGYGEDGLGIDPKVPTDADASIYVADKYIYTGKLTTDLYLSYKMCKHSTLFIGADNLFNVHPDYGFVQTAKYWAFNNESGGPWDAVQMGQNGRRLFARVAFNF